MPISVTCLYCGRTLKAKDEHAGQKAKCPGCDNVIMVPKPKVEPVMAEAVEVEPADAADDREPDYQDDRPRPKKRRPPGKRERPSKGSDHSISPSVVGGLLMMLIAVVWFVGGLFFNIIFFYPPILFVIGIIALVKGLVDR
jgi:transposase